MDPRKALSNYKKSLREIEERLAQAKTEATAEAKTEATAEAKTEATAEAKTNPTIYQLDISTEESLVGVRYVIEDNILGPRSKLNPIDPFAAEYYGAGSIFEDLFEAKNTDEYWMTGFFAATYLFPSLTFGKFNATINTLVVGANPGTISGLDHCRHVSLTKCKKNIKLNLFCFTTKQWHICKGSNQHKLSNYTFLKGAHGDGDIGKIANIHNIENSIGNRLDMYIQDHDPTDANILGAIRILSTGLQRDGCSLVRIGSLRVETGSSSSSSTRSTTPLLDMSSDLVYTFSLMFDKSHLWVSPWGSPRKVYIVGRGVKKLRIPPTKALQSAMFDLNMWPGPASVKLHISANNDAYKEFIERISRWMNNIEGPKGAKYVKYLVEFLGQLE